MSRTARKLSDAQMRQRLSKKIAKLVAPKGMSYSEYLVACTAAGTNPSVEDGLFLHWVLSQAFHEGPAGENVIESLCIGLRNGWLLDPMNREQQSYFLDALVDSVCVDREMNRLIYSAFFEGYQTAVSIPIWHEMMRLNSIFAFDFKMFQTSLLKQTLHRDDRCRLQT